jgi:hypothetical protein
MVVVITYMLIQQANRYVLHRWPRVTSQSATYVEGTFFYWKSNIFFAQVWIVWFGLVWLNFNFTSLRYDYLIKIYHFRDYSIDSDNI